MSATTRFIQICASYNDLFGLDESGDVYQYNFSTRAWVKLARQRREDDEPANVGRAASRSEDVHRTGVMERGGAS